MMMHGSAGTSMVQGLGNERNRFFEDLQRKTKSIELKLTSLVQEYDKSSHPPPRVFLAKVEELMGEYSRLLEEMNREEVSSFLRLALYQNRPDENPLYVPDRLYTGLHKDLETHEQQYVFDSFLKHNHSSFSLLTILLSQQNFGICFFIE